MLDYFGVFTRGGALLWTLQFAALRHNPVEALNALIRGCLLEERLSDTSFTFTPKQGAAQTLKWTVHNGLGLVFVAVYQKTLSLLYVDELLQMVKAEFVPQYRQDAQSYRHFDDIFKGLLADAERKADDAKRPALTMRVPTNTATAAAAKTAANKGGQTRHPGDKKSSMEASCSSEEDDSADAGGAGGCPLGETCPASLASSDDCTGQDDTNRHQEQVQGAKVAFDVSKLTKGARPVGRAAGPSGPRRRTAAASTNTSNSSKDDVKTAKSDVSKKKMRNWNLLTSRGDDSTTKVDYSDYEEVRVPASSEPAALSGMMQSRMDCNDEEEVEEAETDGLRGAEVKHADQGGTAGDKKKGLLSSFMSSLSLRVVGSSALSSEDLAPALVDMKRKLMERNVAEEIAQQICDSVGKRLEGQKLSSFTGVSSFVSTAFEDSLAGILNKRQVDVLLDIQRSQARQKPYVIVFCGVNGVGKSTNLAKIAYWLLQHNIKVTIAACDTFRAGAVEQLKTHCARLGVPLYERGYEKDPAKVAAEAIRQAERDGNHVVLVDTAGRMQDNEPLMRALSTLINVNEPNLVLFVGEALVGNDAVDQLNKFNRALADLAPTGCSRKHLVDGIVLTKFDTIDDKVGAALSMVYTAGAPVMFVGCGQTYVDLKKLNVKAVVRSLLK